MSFVPTAKDFERYEDEEEQNAKPLPDTETSAIGAGLRAFARAPMTALGALGFPKEHLVYPKWAHEKPGDIKHPVAEFAGSMAFPIGGLAGKIIKGFKTIGQLTQMKNLEQKAGETTEAHEASEEALKNLHNYFKERHGTEKPNFGHKIQESGKKLAEIEPSTETRNLAEKPKINLSNRLPGATGEGQLQDAQNRLQQHVQTGQQYLGHRQPNDVMFQDEMHRMITNNRRQIGRGYDALEQRFNNPNERILVRNSQGELVPAGELLTEFRTLDKQAKLSFDEAHKRSESLTDEQRKELMARGYDLRNRAEELGTFLEENVDSEFKDDLKKLNSQWREYAQLYNNPLAKEIEAQRGIAGTNIMSKMRGSDEGQKLLRNLTLSNPETTRTAIGHTYSENPHAMLEAPEYEQQFIQAEQHLPAYLESAQSHQQNLAQAHQTQQRLQEEAGRVKNAYEEDVKLEKQKESARNKVAEAEKNKAEIRKLIEEYTAHMKEYESLLANKKMTLEQKMRAGQKLESIKKISGRIKKLGKGIGYATLISGEIGLGKKLLETLFK